MSNHVLKEFQEYLRQNSLVQEKYIPFYAHWARKFFDYSTSNDNISHDLQVQKFINCLESNERLADWQVRQANDAITLYMRKFKRINNYSSLDIKDGDSATCSHHIGKLQEALRIKHYAYRTEKKYIETINLWNVHSLQHVNGIYIYINFHFFDV